MFNSVVRSLEDLLGSDYIQAVCRAAALFNGEEASKETARLASTPVEFFPEKFEADLNALLPKIGEQVTEPIAKTIEGAPTNAFRSASSLNKSPVGGKGYYRLGEDGRLYFTAKCEHYHTPLGHKFPGYRLIDLARQIGITNATHNNTRGYITRLLEQELIRTANGLARGDKEGLEKVLKSEEPHVLNRVINLETGSLAAEAGFKMMLARFFRLEATFPERKYEGKTPVFLVMKDDFGGSSANYHGTTVLVQTMRGLWPELLKKMTDAEIFKVVPVAINDIADFEAKVKEYNSGNYRVAGFLHELVLMNYGGTVLKKDYIRKAYEICRANDIPVMVDEIQSCMWYSGLYLFKQYGLNPDFVIIGKGFSGGEYPASKVITTAEMDTLNQFGALVTNGQEELASLSYLITMEFVTANGDVLDQLGELYEKALRQFPVDFPNQVEKIEGIGLLEGIHFKDAGKAMAFAKKLGADCIDASAHGYKSVSLPAVLTKMPIIGDPKTIEFIVAKMRKALAEMEAGE